MDGGLDLLDLQHEGIAAVAVDEAGAGAAVAVREGDPLLEVVGVVARVLERGLRPRDGQPLARVPDERRRFGRSELLAASRRPTTSSTGSVSLMPRIMGATPAGGGVARRPDVACRC